jgi:hypothetical protein
MNVCGISPGFPGLSPMHGQVAHVLRTRSPLDPPRRQSPVRLACVKRAASVRPEPGSNSPLSSNSSLGQTLVRLSGIRVDSFPVFSGTRRTRCLLPAPLRSLPCHGAPCSSTPQHPDCQSCSRGPLTRFFLHGNRPVSPGASRSDRPASGESFNLTHAARPVNPSRPATFPNSEPLRRRSSPSI